MFDPSSFANPTPLAHADTSRDVLPRGGTSQWRPTRFNLYDPEMRNARGFNVWPEVYFSGSENVTEFLEGIDNQIKLLEIPSDLSCAYLKGHLLGRALDWYQIFGSTLVQNIATDFTQLKAALSKAFPAIQNRKDLETRFYASQQRQNQEPTDFVYDLLKLHKKLELGMSEKALVDYIFIRLEPQVQDYVEVRNPQTAIQLLEELAKFEDRYSCKATLGSINSNNVEGRGWNEHRKCDETEIGTGSSDNGSLRHESSGFDRVQRRSNDSRDGKKKGSEVKRELEEKGLSFRNNQGEKHTNKTNKRGPLIRSIPSSWSEKCRMIKKSKNERLGYKRSYEYRSRGPERKVQKGSEHRVNKRALSSNYRTNHSLTKFRKKSRREETVTPTTSGYNLRPRIGKEKTPDRP
ncbi:uncharacterized protein TNCV_3838891 [Trichonephila clavipes]|nr:uncharacterized protein TNCV_3838891 [Trichonephila clavipes]